MIAVLAVAFGLAVTSLLVPRDLWWLRAASIVVMLGVPLVLVLAFRLLTVVLANRHDRRRFAAKHLRRR